MEIAKAMAAPPGDAEAAGVWDGLSASELEELAEEMDAVELLGLAEALGAGPLAGLILAKAQETDQVGPGDLIRLTALYDRQTRWCQAQAALALGQACEQADEGGGAGDCPPAWALIDEAALVCGRTRRWAGELARVGRAALDTPALKDSLDRGLVDRASADAILRAANRLKDRGDRARVVAHGLRLAVLPVARPDIQDGCERLAAKLDPQGLSHAHQTAYQERSFRYRARAASMGMLTVYGAAHELSWVQAAVEAAVRDQPGDQEDGAAPRTMAQRRHDAFIAHFRPAPGAEGGTGGLGQVGGAPVRPPDAPLGPRYEVLVRLDATTLLGLDDNPGLILGAGPIPAEVGRQIAADATWRGLFVDPLSGRPVWASPKAFRAGIVLGPTSPLGRDGKPPPRYPVYCPNCGGPPPGAGP
ncbi:MAG: 13E12 repeat family protein, partial [Bifidobacteriaceae bacterium]|nr:13E12 repeat family protein [Bifidobacteriaceae bacterium]